MNPYQDFFNAVSDLNYLAKCAENKEIPAEYTEMEMFEQIRKLTVEVLQFKNKYNISDDALKNKFNISDDALSFLLKLEAATT